MLLNITNRSNGENSRNYIYKTIRENILSLTLEPGQVISETDFTDIFQVSRTPIREAFIKLSEENLIDIFPQKGTYVTPISMDYVEEARFMRTHLEKAVLLEAIAHFPEKWILELKKVFALQKTLIEIEYNPYEFLKLDNLFHKTIFDGVEKGRIWAQIDNMSTHYNRLRMIDLAGKINISKILEQHEVFIEIIENQNKGGADISKLLTIHLTNIFDKLDSLSEQYPNYFIK